MSTGTAVWNPYMPMPDQVPLAEADPGSLQSFAEKAI
jgi:hypothetical protein